MCFFSMTTALDGRPVVQRGGDTDRPDMVVNRTVRQRYTSVLGQLSTLSGRLTKPPRPDTVIRYRPSTGTGKVSG